MTRYFVNTGDGVEYYDSLAEAETAAHNAIDGWRECCDPEWPEEVESVCYGKVLGRSTQVPCQTGLIAEEQKYVNYELHPQMQTHRCPFCKGSVTSKE